MRNPARRFTRQAANRRAADRRADPGPEPLIHLAFRFHGNFYHSYRGDTLDEQGFGKDIRIVRHILRELDQFNSGGIPVRGTWDFENYFSLERIIPRHAPDIIEALQRRVSKGVDEINLMSWNNGLAAVHSEEEFDAAVGRAISNPNGSGVADLFADWAPIVRPQEMMFTPDQLRLYRKHGIEAVSLYYSALPFNGFSSFIPPLPLHRRYNPLSLSYPGIPERMTLIPTYGIGDIVDHLTLRRWLTQLRRRQLRGLGSRADSLSFTDRSEMSGTGSPGAGAGAEPAHPADLLLLIDMDADTDFWVSLAGPTLSRLFPTVGGLRRIVESVVDLPWLRFTTPGTYLANHPPVAEVRFGQDTADGRFDGYSSWAEKRSSQELWTLLEQSRLYSMQARALSGRSTMEELGMEGLEKEGLGLEELGMERPPADEAEALREAFERRIRGLSTTHFGMAEPIMNRTRLRTAREILEGSRDAALRALHSAGGVNPAPPPPTANQGFQYRLFDYSRRAVASAPTRPPAAGQAADPADPADPSPPADPAPPAEPADPAGPAGRPRERRVLLRLPAPTLGGSSDKAGDSGNTLGPPGEAGRRSGAVSGTLAGSVTVERDSVAADAGPRRTAALLLPSGALVVPLRYYRQESGRDAAGEFAGAEPAAGRGSTDLQEIRIRAGLEDFTPAETATVPHMAAPAQEPLTVTVGDWALDVAAGPGLADLRFQGSAVLAELPRVRAAGGRRRGITGSVLRSAVRYAGSVHQVSHWSVTELAVSPDRRLAVIRLAGSLQLGHSGRREHRPSAESTDAPFTVTVSREIVVADDMPYLYLRTRVDYPATPHRGYNRERAERLESSWDERWQEVMPCEMRPDLTGRVRIWKHAFTGAVTSYVPDYSEWSRNRELDAVNNHTTNGWVAVSNGNDGLLIAQDVSLQASMAFCPMRTRRVRTGRSRAHVLRAPVEGDSRPPSIEPAGRPAFEIYLNPFGTYDGRQYSYPTASTGLGRFSAVTMSAADHIHSSAPSYNGVSQEFALLLCPYQGDAPPAEIQDDAMAFAYCLGWRR